MIPNIFLIDETIMDNSHTTDETWSIKENVSKTDNLESSQLLFSSNIWITSGQLLFALSYCFSNITHYITGSVFLFTSVYVCLYQFMHDFIIHHLYEHIVYLWSDYFIHRGVL